VSLAYDKRGAGQSTGDTYGTDYGGYADDAAAAIASLRSRPDVVSNEIFAMGFSEGEWVGIQLPKWAEIGGLILVGASGLTPLGQTNEEIALRLRAKHFGKDDIQRAVETNLRYHEYLRGDLDENTLKSELDTVVDKPWFSAAKDLYSEVYPRKEFSWWRSVMDFDPKEDWHNLNVPVLFLKGAKDDRSDATSSVARVRSFMNENAKKQLQVQVFSDAGHMLLVWPFGDHVPPPMFASGYPSVVVEWLNDQTDGEHTK
jgi:hypothetical protein